MWRRGTDNEKETVSVEKSGAPFGCCDRAGRPVLLRGFCPEKESSDVYSVILYQNTEDEWGTLIQGIMQAEEDLNVDVNYIYLSENDTAEDQIKEVNKEIRGKSSGILMAAVNSREIQEVLENMMISIPIIFVETGAGDSFPVIRSDDYAMGKALGRLFFRIWNRQETPGR